jgi:hypothetical protein
VSGKNRLAARQIGYGSGYPQDPGDGPGAQAQLPDRLPEQNVPLRALDTADGPEPAALEVRVHAALTGELTVASLRDSRFDDRCGLGGLVLSQIGPRHGLDAHREVEAIARV